MQLIKTKLFARLAIVLALVSLLLFVVYQYRRELLFEPYRNYRSSLAQIERIEISLSDSDARLLDSLRLDALKTGKVTPQHKSYVSANLLFQDSVYEIKLRLKGDQLDHYQNNPPSYRVKVLDDKPVLGSNKISIHSFGNRNFLSEWLYHKLLAQRDVLSLNMDVIELRVNGMETICTFEEHFTHFLTDRFNRPHGPIICISEDLFWSNVNQGDAAIKELEQSLFTNSAIKVFNVYTTLDSNDVQKAKSLLDQFRKNVLSASDVFDIDRLAIHYAICDLTNTHHALRWHNNRFYYNPTTEKLEPIGFDGSSWELLSVFAFEDDFLPAISWSKLSSDKAFVDAYIRELENVSSEDYLNNFVSEYEEDLYHLGNKFFRKKSSDSTEVYRNDLVFANHYHWLYTNAEWIRNNLDAYRTRLLSNDHASGVRSSTKR